MHSEQVALDYSNLTMNTLISQGADMKEVAAAIIRFARTSTLSKGAQCKPVLIGQNIAFDIGFLQQLMNYAGLAAEFESDLTENGRNEDDVLNSDNARNADGGICCAEDGANGSKAGG